MLVLLKIKYRPFLGDPKNSKQSDSLCIHIVLQSGLRPIFGPF